MDTTPRVGFLAVKPWPEPTGWAPPPRTPTTPGSTPATRFHQPHPPSKRGGAGATGGAAGTQASRGPRQASVHKGAQPQRIPHPRKRRQRQPFSAASHMAAVKRPRHGDAPPSRAGTSTPSKGASWQPEGPATASCPPFGHEPSPPRMTSWQPPIRALPRRRRRGPSPPRMPSAPYHPPRIMNQARVHYTRLGKFLPYHRHSPRGAGGRERGTDVSSNLEPNGNGKGGCRGLCLTF